MYKDYQYLIKMPNLKKNKTYWNKYKAFIKEQSMIFKIIAAPL